MRKIILILEEIIIKDKIIRKKFQELKNELKFYIIDKKTRKTNFKKIKEPIRLNLGCGTNIKKNFINIDLNKKADLRLDLRKRLPFKNNTIDYIYSEHFFEHLNYTNRTALRCIHDYFRILKKGAKIKLVIPDIEKKIKAYVNRDFKHFEHIDIEKKIPQSKEFSSIIDYLNYSFYQFGEHKYSYDFEKINLLLKSVGFKKIIKGDYDPEEDSYERKKSSLYIITEK